MLRSLIFDWSGTLCDDFPLAFRLTNETLTEFGGNELTLAQFNAQFSLPVASFYRKLLPSAPLEKIEKFFFERYTCEAATLPLFPNVDLLLKYAAANQYAVYILSTIDASCIEQALRREGLSHAVHHIEGRAFDKHATVRRLLDQFALVPDEVLLVGDMPHDLRSGREAGTQTGASLYGYSRRKALEAENADYWFDSVLSIFQHVQERVVLDHYPRPTITVGGLVFNPCGELLLVRTHKWTEHYGTPGGKVEFGESAAEAFRREMREETSLDVHSIEFATTDEGILSEEFREPKHFLFLNFFARTDSNDVRLNYEAQDWRWIRPQEALKINLNTPTRKLIEFYLSNRK